MPFVKQELIGSGGFGLVWRGTSEIEGQEQAVAIKELKDYDEKSLARFRRELRILLEHPHENVVPVLAHDLADDPPYYIMPLAVGNLRVLLPSVTIDARRRDFLMSEVLDGLSYLHIRGIVHRDLKPENILLFRNSDAFEGDEWSPRYLTARISDFGIARDMLSSSSTLTTSPLGTVAYAAPEQLFDPKSVTEATDVYALGVVLRELATGSPLVDPDHPTLDRIPLGEAHVIERATSPDATRRFSSAVAMRASWRCLVSELHGASREARAYVIWALGQLSGASVFDFGRVLLSQLDHGDPGEVLFGTPSVLLSRFAEEDEDLLIELTDIVTNKLVHETKREGWDSPYCPNVTELESAANFLFRLSYRVSKKARIVDMLLNILSVGAASNEFFAPGYCFNVLLAVLNSMAKQGRGRTCLRILRGRWWLVPELRRYFGTLDVFDPFYHDALKPALQQGTLLTPDRPNPAP